MILNDIPEDAVCMEDGCTLAPVGTRPISQAWLTDNGLIIEGTEIVCAVHMLDAATTA